MGNQYSYPESKENQTKLEEQVKSLGTQVQTLNGVINNFMSVEGFGGETQKQIKAFMGEVVLGATEASQLLIENVDTEYKTMQKRFQGIDGAENTIIYDSRLNAAITQNDEYATKLMTHANEINGLIREATNLGVRGRLCNTAEITAHQNATNTKIQQLRDKLTAEGKNKAEADGLDTFIDSVRQFISYLGNCQPSSYNSGGLAAQPFYRNGYMPKAVEIMKNKPYDYFAGKKPDIMTPIEQIAIVEKLAKSYDTARKGDKNQEIELENFMNKIAQNAANKGYSESNAEHVEDLQKSVSDEVKSWFNQYQNLIRTQALLKSELAYSLYRSGEDYDGAAIQGLLSEANLESRVSSMFGAVAHANGKILAVDSKGSYNFNVDFPESNVADNLKHNNKEFVLNFKTSNDTHSYAPGASFKDVEIIGYGARNGQMSISGDLSLEESKDLSERADSLNFNKTLGNKFVSTLSGKLIGGVAKVLGKAASAITIPVGLIIDTEKQMDEVNALNEESIKEEIKARIIKFQKLAPNTGLILTDNNSINGIVIPSKETMNAMKALEQYGNGNRPSELHGDSPYRANQLSDFSKDGGADKFIKEYEQMVDDAINNYGLSKREVIQENISQYGNPCGDPNTSELARRWANEHR